MLVNVNYTIKFDEIPRKVRREITEDIGYELGLLKAETTAVASYLEPGTDQNILKAIQTIDNIRQGLTLADAKLRDCYNMLAGYQQALVNPEAEQEGHSTEELLSQLQKTVEDAEHANG
jgi:hypothetical protein